MAAGKLNLYIEQGSTFQRVFQLRVGGPGSAAVNLSGYGVRAQMQFGVDGTPVSVSPVVAVLSPASAGRISFAIPDTVSSAVEVPPGNYSMTLNGSWDLEAYNLTTDAPIRLLNGISSLSPEVPANEN